MRSFNKQFEIRGFETVELQPPDQYSYVTGEEKKKELFWVSHNKNAIRMLHLNQRCTFPSLSGYRPVKIPKDRLFQPSPGP